MKHFYILCSFFLVQVNFLNAQQGVQYTQFMFNKLAFNPAYAGSGDSPCVSCIHRSQWVGLEGAPTSQTINFHSPFLRKKVGIGISLQNDRIGPSNSTWVNISYAYHIKINESKLSIGLQGTMRSYKLDLNETNAIVDNDPAVLSGSLRKILPNLGAGAYFLSPNFYMGVSIPYLLNGDISFIENPGVSSSQDFSTEDRHLYAMAGFKIEISPTLKFKPAVMLKFVENAPIDIDINGSLLFNDFLGLGAAYRLGGIRNSIGESVDFLGFVNLNSGFTIGLAFDLSISRIRKYNAGSFEIMINKCFGLNKKNRKKLTNPRFFL